MSANNTENQKNGADLSTSEEIASNEKNASEIEVVETEIKAEEAPIESKSEVETSHKPQVEEPETSTSEYTDSSETLPEEKVETVEGKKESNQPETANLEPATEKSHQDIEEIESDEEEEDEFSQENFDFSDFDKKAYVALAERLLDAIKKNGIKPSEVKSIDAVARDLKASFDVHVSGEKADALKTYIEENGNEEGFEYRNDNLSIRFESLSIQLREERQAFFQKLDALKEDYFERKTKLLQELREVVDAEETGGSRENWEKFKQIQQAWKDVGNVPSPHNGSLWSAYNALLDRFFDIRSIQNELKELDRKKNLETRTEYVEKIEEIASSLKDTDLTTTVLNKANELLNEYKHTGPGPRAEQDALWDRLKAAFDIIYDKKRSQDKELEKVSEEIFAAKASLVDKLVPYTQFNSESINEWNEKSKEVLAIQEQWNNLKGPMPRAKAKETSKAFWGHLKTFFKNKSAYFAKLDKEREKNLQAKEALCNEVSALVEAGDTSPENTKKVIELQKTWKSVGHVPKKYKDSIYNKFKKACDEFFDLKRSANKEQLEEYKENLKKKEAICQEIEDAVKAKDTEFDRLADFKKAFGEIGFVPRSDMDKIQNRFVKAINAYLKESSDLGKEELEKALLKNEVEVTMNAGGNPKALQKQEYDLKRKLKSLEDDINQLKTNIEFFGHSKGAEKLKAEYEKKIEKSENEANKLRDKIRLISSATA